jgi:ABC-type Mn2+/Zn2+ transport system permease subunit
MHNLKVRLIGALLMSAILVSTAANATYLHNNISVTSGGTASASTSDNGP